MAIPYQEQCDLKQTLESKLHFFFFFVFPSLPLPFHSPFRLEPFPDQLLHMPQAQGLGKRARLVLGIMCHPEALVCRALGQWRGGHVLCLGATPSRCLGTQGPWLPLWPLPV